MSIKQAETLRDDLTAYIGEAIEASTEAAKKAAELATALEQAGPDYSDERKQASAWAGRLVGSVCESLASLMSEVEGDDSEAEPVSDDDPQVITLSRGEIKEVNKVLAFIQQLESSEFDSDRVSSASLTFQLAVVSKS